VNKMSEEVERVNVYNGEGEVVARVRYTSNLDFWDGRNWSSGSMGHHQGLTKLRDGRYVIVYGSQWQGDRPWAEIVSPERALQAIVHSDNLDLLDEKRFSELKKKYDEDFSDQEEVE